MSSSPLRSTSICRCCVARRVYFWTYIKTVGMCHMHETTVNEPLPPCFGVWFITFAACKGISGPFCVVQINGVAARSTQPFVYFFHRASSIQIAGSELHRDPSNLQPTTGNVTFRCSAAQENPPLSTKVAYRGLVIAWCPSFPSTRQRRNFVSQKTQGSLHSGFCFCEADCT